MSEEVSISINEVSHPILCGTCKKPIAFIGEADAETGEAGCLSCGNIANVQEVASMAIKYAKDEGQLQLNRMARDAARDSKVMNFSGQTEHNKPHRFVVDMKL
ncbi:MAG: hypothetical protein AAFR88_06775 [Pseudomonadota bacterium]